MLKGIQMSTTFPDFDTCNKKIKPSFTNYQPKIFINGVLKVQNQAIGMILHITILIVLPKDKKGGGGVLISATRGVY